VTFTSPAWLLLALPLALACLRWRPATRALRFMRILLFITLLLALARLAIVLPSRQGTVVLVADRSASMPLDADARERELVRDLETSRGDSRLGVVSFGRAANVELTPGNGRFTAFQGENGADASSLRDGLETALALIPPDTSGRIVVVSDGHWSGRDPAPAALAAADRGIAVDYRLVERVTSGDTAIESVDAPASVSPREAFLIGASIHSPVAQDISVILRRWKDVVAEGRQKVSAGKNQLTFRDRAARGGVQSYTLEVRGAGNDPQPENNVARFLVGVNGPKPVLVVPGSDDSRFAAMLAAGGVQIDVKKRPEWSVDELSGYSAVVLENVAANTIGASGMQTLSAWVQGGGSLMVTGGQSSFAAGGYFHSPLDAVLPVSMEMRREHRKLNLSIVIAMDRSGSMAMTAGGGKTKMDLANLAAVQVVDLLGPNDEVGVVAVDSSSHIIADLDRLEGRKDLRRKILSVESMGGGIFIYEALSTAAKMLISARSPTRHIILFADAADSEEPGDYINLLDKCAKANITVSVIGLGTPQDSDAGLLEDIAKRGDGHVYFTDDPSELPRIFAQDTFVVARSAFVRDVTPVHATPALVSLTGRNFGVIPSVGGYNLTYLKQGASPAILTDDEYHAPLVAAWQAGLGRVIAYTAEADGEFTGPLAKWNEVGALDASLVRWIAGAAEPLSGDMLVRQHVENGAARIELHLDPERSSNPITRAPRVVTLNGKPGAAAKSTSAEMRWATPDLLETEVPLDGNATSLSTVVIEGAGHVTLPPVCAPYSPEHAPVDEAAGRSAMDRLSRATGGRERISVADVWRDLPKRRREIPLRAWLIAAAMVMLLIETLERRMSWSAGLLGARASRPHPQLARKDGRRDARAPRAVAREKPPTPALPEPEDDALVTALRRAKDRATRN
jgi:uncharacterized membrane protein